MDRLLLTRDDHIAYRYHPLQNLGDMDMTFLIDLRVHEGREREGVIARKAGVWEMRLNRQGQLELELQARKQNRSQIIRSKLPLAAGTRYSVAFSIVGMKRLANYARLYVRAASHRGFIKVGEGLGVRNAQFNTDGIELGTSKQVGRSIDGTLWNPRLFIAPFTADELSAVHAGADQ